MQKILIIIWVKSQGGTMPEDLPTPSKSLKQLGSKNEIT